MLLLLFLRLKSRCCIADTSLTQYKMLLDAAGSTRAVALADAGLSFSQRRIESKAVSLKNQELLC